MEFKLALVSLNLGPPSLYICACTSAHEKVNGKGMLMTKLHVLICLIRSVILVFHLQEEAVFHGQANGKNTDSRSVTYGINSF